MGVGCVEPRTREGGSEVDLWVLDGCVEWVWCKTKGLRPLYIAERGSEVGKGLGYLWMVNTHGWL